MSVINFTASDQLELLKVSFSYVHVYSMSFKPLRARWDGSLVQPRSGQSLARSGRLELHFRDLDHLWALCLRADVIALGRDGIDALDRVAFYRKGVGEGTG